MHRAALLLIVTATFTSASWAQLNKLELAATKVETRPEGTRQITLHVQNNSNKAIAALTVELTLKLDDGASCKCS